ncbi:hypothetical protein STCU_10594 [Strigomonas culicis]|uniref:Uncharacterized protein n=1 Tax=Strigomonas culicis TaxID=28005 RepID=S9THI0_9TRYP|nr:hypothetical protein STCU_10594 [Strigomonas culicis]|eukprot:EPY17502.1 hypothetical protein STCU_10594 [Strigomonas culicis]
MWWMAVEDEGAGRPLVLRVRVGFLLLVAAFTEPLGPLGGGWLFPVYKPAYDDEATVVSFAFSIDNNVLLA